MTVHFCENKHCLCELAPLLGLNSICQLWPVYCVLRRVLLGWLREGVYWSICYCLALWQNSFYFGFSNLAQEIMLWNPTTLLYEALLSKILPGRQVHKYVPNLKKLDKENLKIYIRRWNKINSALFLFLSILSFHSLPSFKVFIVIGEGM